MGILNIGTQALQANQVALQTTGNNIANVNTPGYSRQRTILQANEGQFTGSGYIGKGVSVQTIQRNFDAFLTRQANITGAAQAADTARADKLKQLEALFPGGANGLGASINDMLNAFSDVASAPTDLTARTVALTRVDETASRMRSAAMQLNDMQQGLRIELESKINSINSLAKGIADVNAQIANAQGNGQTPNDLLDRRDQLVRELNQYVQTSSVPADDGTIGLFIGGSQSLVLGTSASTVSLASDTFHDPLQNKLAITRGGVSISLDEDMLGGGEVPGLLRFQNTDMVEASNLLGRLTMAVSQSVNTQHRLGIDLNGNVGGDLLTPVTFNNLNVLTPQAPATSNAGTSTLTLGISNASQFAASDYEMNMTSATAGSLTRRSDGQVTNFNFATTNPVVIDGLTITQGGGAAVAGDRFLIKPFSSAATNVSRQFASPSALAVASPVAGSMGTGNTGTLQMVSLTARTNPPSVTPVVLTFTGANSYTRSDELPVPNATTFTYTPGTSIEGTTPTSTPLAQWSVTLQGAPKAGDTFTVNNIKVLALTGKVDYKLNAGNATAMMNLRDVPTFDGAAMTDGYAGLISQIGVRVQSATYAADVSTSIAASVEQDRSAISGVNLDEEAAKLLQYQQAYQASAKMIQIAQNIFDTLIQGLSR
jgi:flagellar hook-associated protein 1